MDENRKNGFIIVNDVLTKYSGFDGDVVIPDGVTEIGANAFDENSTLNAVVITDNVARIGNDAFFTCDELTDVVIGRGLEYVGKSAFSGCCDIAGIYVDPLNAHFHSKNNCLIETASKTLVRGCTNSVIPADGSVEIIRETAFDCTEMKQINIPYGVKQIGEEAFSDCDLIEIELPESVESIDYGAFTRCRNLERVKIPASVKHIGRRAFAGCNSIKEIDVSLANMRYEVAGDCLIESSGKTLLAGFGSFRVPDDGRIKVIGERAFFECRELTQMVIPRGVTEIEKEAFSTCKQLESLVLPDGLTTIGKRAFATCSGLTSVELPGSVTDIGEQAFAGCYSLNVVKLPHGVTRIADRTFERCHDLASVTVPSTVKEIGAYALAWNINLYDIMYDGTVEQWNAIEKGDHWALASPHCVVHCTDGDVEK